MNKALSIVRNIFEKYAKRAAVVILAALLLVILCFFSIRGWLLDKAFHRVSEKLKNEYNTVLSAESLSWSGLSSITINSLNLVPCESDTLLKVKELKIGLGFSNLLVGNIELEEFDGNSIAVKLLYKNGKYNFSCFLKEGKSKKVKSGQNAAYHKLLKKVLRKYFEFTPRKSFVEDLKITYTDSVGTLGLSLTSLQLEDGKTEFSFKLNDAVKDMEVKAKAIVKPDDEEILLCLNADNTVNLPFLEQKLGLKAGFDELSIGLNSLSTGSKETSIRCELSAINLRVHHPRLSTQDILLNGKGSILIAANEASIRVDSSSECLLNTLLFHPYVEYSSKPHWIALGIGIPDTEAKDFFKSLPKGMFNVASGINATGSLGYRMCLKLDPRNPETTQFSSRIYPNQLRISSYEDEYLPKMNASFPYTAYEKGQAVRTFIVGPDNPNYTPLLSISPYLIASVLTSEDGSFMYHNGFNEEAFRKSIIENIRKKRFARGGSTITMQLVKNVFLSRNKTIARKAEEALLVWLIERFHLVGKSRMLEVYFNIIEWGPMVYGIGEASQFYFAKSPSQLTLEECIFLASIVPKPKRFMWSFDENGQLREYMAGYYRLVSGIMLRRGQISQEDFDKLYPVIELKGRAKNFLQNVNPDVFKTDSLKRAEEEEDIEIPVPLIMDHGA